jgi:SAM-dependent methyltransferase
MTQAGGTNDMGNLGNPAHALGKFIRSNPSVSDRDPPVHGVLAALDLEPDSVVVEIGAGIGHYTIPIASLLDRLGGDGLVFGLEVAHALVARLEHAMEHNDLDRRIRPMPIEGIGHGSLPIRDGSVDRVLAVNSLQYLEDPLPGYMEVARILKPGGFALLVDWRQSGVSEPPSPVPAEVNINSVALDVLSTGMLVPGGIALPGYSFAVRALKRTGEPLQG